MNEIAVAEEVPQNVQEAYVQLVNSALLIDFDSINSSRLVKWLNQLKLTHYFLVTRAYCDWSGMNHEIVKTLMLSSVELIQVPVYSPQGSKNGVDIRLTIDAIELSIKNPAITRYIIFGSDSDYISLVVKLREYGKEVYFIGNEKSTSDALIGYCTYFSYFTDVDAPEANQANQYVEIRQQNDPDRIYQLLDSALSALRSKGEQFPVRDSKVNEVMIRLDASYNYKRYGFQTLKDFLETAKQNGQIHIRWKNNQIYVDLPSRSSSKSNSTNTTASSQKQGNIDDFTPNEMQWKVLDIFEFLKKDGRVSYSQMIQQARDLQTQGTISFDPVPPIKEFESRGIFIEHYLPESPSHKYLKLPERLATKLQARETPYWLLNFQYRNRLNQLYTPVDLGLIARCYDEIQKLMTTQNVNSENQIVQQIMESIDIPRRKVDEVLNFLKPSGLLYLEEESQLYQLKSLAKEELYRMAAIHVRDQFLTRHPDSRLDRLSALMAELNQNESEIQKIIKEVFAPVNTPPVVTSAAE